MRVKRISEAQLPRQLNAAKVATAQMVFDVKFQKKAAALGSTIWLARLLRVAKRIRARGLTL